MLKKYENFTGKIKNSNSEIDNSEIIDLVNIIIQLKPGIPDIFPKKDVSKLITNSVIYLSDDDKFKININFHESDSYIDKEGNIVFGKYKSVFRIDISDINNGNFKISDIRDFIVISTNIILKSYENVKCIVKFDDNKFTIEEFNNEDDSKLITAITFIIKII